MQVTIKTRSVGQAFGCEAYAVDSAGKTVRVSRLFPYGFDGAAYQHMVAACVLRGWVVS